MNVNIFINQQYENLKLITFNVVVEKENLNYISKFELLVNISQCINVYFII